MIWDDTISQNRPSSLVLSAWNMYIMETKIERNQVEDYTDPAHCCAYLHKYAALHTTMVRDILVKQSIQALICLATLWFQAVHSEYVVLVVVQAQASVK